MIWGYPHSRKRPYDVRMIHDIQKKMSCNKPGESASKDGTSDGNQIYIYIDYIKSNRASTDWFYIFGCFKSDSSWLWAASAWSWDIPCQETRLFELGEREHVSRLGRERQAPGLNDMKPELWTSLKNLGACFMINAYFVMRFCSFPLKQNQWIRYFEGWV